jgi:carbon-monoxide dehydrogenase large subunit
VLGAGSLRAACDDLRARILEAAAEALEVAQADLELVGGQARVRGAPERAIGLARLARSHPGRLDVTAAYDPPRAAFPSATHATVVEVDRRTGLSRIVAYVVAEDCGTIINPLIVDGQIQGAVAQGVGGALLEALEYDAQGQLLTASFLDYLLPTAAEMPSARVMHLETPSPVVPGGFKGVGEGGTLAPPAAVANALSDALGVEVNALPASPPRIRALLRAAGDPPLAPPR